MSVCLDDCAGGIFQISHKPRTGLQQGGQRRPTSAFWQVVEAILSLDRAIRWVAWEETGQPPRWVWRDPGKGNLQRGTGSWNDELLDPLIPVLAERRNDIYGMETDSPQVRFIIIAYRNLVQVAVPCGPHSHLTFGVEPGADACRLATTAAGMAASVSARCSSVK